MSTRKVSVTLTLELPEGTPAPVARHLLQWAMRDAANLARVSEPQNMDPEHYRQAEVLYELGKRSEIHTDI